MEKLTLDNLKKLRETERENLNRRSNDNKNTYLIIGMGTCGIAAGAKETFSALLNAIEKNKLHNVAIKQTGCMGMCDTEPTVEVMAPGMPTVIYGHVNAEIAKDIVEKHLMKKQLLEDLIQDRPAADILKKEDSK